MMKDDERFAKRIADPLRTPERVDAHFTARVMASVWAVQAAESPSFPERLTTFTRVSRGAEPWWQRRITINMTRLEGVLTAAIAVIMTVAGVVALRERSTVSPDLPVVQGANVGMAVHHDTTYVVRFVLHAPAASSVALVGDFNNWNRNAVHLMPTGRDGLWTASVVVPVGRHEYAFIVDGTRWTADPHAELRVADDFGIESSILTVGERATAPAT